MEEIVESVIALSFMAWFIVKIVIAFVQGDKEMDEEYDNAIWDVNERVGHLMKIPTGAIEMKWKHFKTLFDEFSGKLTAVMLDWRGDITLASIKEIPNFANKFGCYHGMRHGNSKYWLAGFLLPTSDGKQAFLYLPDDDKMLCEMQKMASDKVNAAKSMDRKNRENKNARISLDVVNSLRHDVSENVKKANSETESAYKTYAELVSKIKPITITNNEVALSD